MFSAFGIVLPCSTTAIFHLYFFTIEQVAVCITVAVYFKKHMFSFPSLGNQIQTLNFGLEILCSPEVPILERRFHLSVPLCFVKDYRNN